jgi:branched-chain amino acid transport system permease protein
MSELVLQSIFSGLLMGASYALIGLGLALVFGTMKIINLAHGELVLLSAYIAYTMESTLGWNPLGVIPLSILVVCTCAILVYFLVSRIQKNRELNSLILTFGIGIIITNLCLMIWAANVRSTSVSWFQEGVVLGFLYSMRSELLFFAAGLALLAIIWYWLKKSWYGRAVRAVSSHRDASKLMGINPQFTEMLSFVLAGLTGSFAGIAIYCTNVINPPLGATLTVKAFIVTVLAGLGSIPGLLVGSILLGLGESLTITLLRPSLRELAGMILFLLVLFVLPNGLFGGARRRG